MKQLTITENKELSHSNYIDQNLELIANQNKLSRDDLTNFAIQCKRTGLDPITRQIYAIPSNGKLTIMASIDGLRLIAERSNQYEGQTAPLWCGNDGKWVDVWLSNEPPRACKIGVYKSKFKEPLYAVALFDEYAGKYQYDDKYGKHKKGDLNYMWGKMPALMISKVAEALALRKAFPNEMSGIYATEEIHHDNEPTTFNEKEATGKKEYVVKVGYKYLGKKLHEIPKDDVINFLNYLKNKSIKGTISVDEHEFINEANNYLL